MVEYLTLLEKILESGVEKPDRTGTGTRSIFGYQMRFDLSTTFPLLTTKKVHFKSIVYELLWFIKGESNINYLKENKVSIWDEWADERGDLGPVYGVQWRSWKNHKGETIDQLADVIQKIQAEPNSRRLIVSAWNVGEIPEMALPPCHLLFQFYVVDGKLSCQMYQRSADVFLGIPFNIASYALLTRMTAQVCGLLPGELILTLGDTHLYNNHLKQAREQLSRSPLSLPRLALNPTVMSIFDFNYEDIHLLDYHSHPRISAPISV